jgi:hypothetical protein
MPHSSDLLALAHAVLRKQRDSAWYSGGTVAKKLSQASVRRGTAENPIKQSDDATVPLSQTLGTGTAGHPKNPGTARGTVVGHAYLSVLSALRSKCPELVRWLSVTLIASSQGWAHRLIRSAGLPANCSACIPFQRRRHRRSGDCRAMTARG